MLSLPSAAEPLLMSFSIAFTEPTFQRILPLSIGAILTLGLLALLDWRQPLKPAPGETVLLWGLGFSTIMFGLTLLRSDPAPVWLGLRLDAWAAAFFLAACMLGLTVYKNIGKGREEKG